MTVDHRVQRPKSLQVCLPGFVLLVSGRKIALLCQFKPMNLAGYAHTIGNFSFKSSAFFLTLFLWLNWSKLAEQEHILSNLNAVPKTKTCTTTLCIQSWMKVFETAEKRKDFLTKGCAVLERQNITSPHVQHWEIFWGVIFSVSKFTCPPPPLLYYLDLIFEAVQLSQM